MKDYIVAVDTLKARALDSLFCRMDEGEFDEYESDLYCVMNEQQRLFKILKEFECDAE